MYRIELRLSIYRYTIRNIARLDNYFLPSDLYAEFIVGYINRLLERDKPFNNLENLDLDTRASSRLSNNNLSLLDVRDKATNLDKLEKRIERKRVKGVELIERRKVKKRAEASKTP